MQLEGVQTPGQTREGHRSGRRTGGKMRNVTGHQGEADPNPNPGEVSPHTGGTAGPLAASSRGRRGPSALPVGLHFGAAAVGSGLGDPRKVKLGLL